MRLAAPSAIRNVLLILAAIAALSPPVHAQGMSIVDTNKPLKYVMPEPPQPWSYSISGALYVLSDQDDLFQPTLRADCRRLHLEARYNYEDRESVSIFFGTNLETGGDALALSVTPMLGAVVGRTAGVIPGLELSLAWKGLEAYGESEYVLVSGGDGEDYFYMWSELGLWATDWLRAGGAAQRTRVHHADRDVQPGLLVGARRARVDGTVYLFSPGGDDAYTVVSVVVSF